MKLLIILCFIFTTGCSSLSSISHESSPCARALPGIIEGEEYDKGGEGVAYHDSDSVNQGSVCCNTHFRVDEGPDINKIGDHDYGVGGVLPRYGARYLGWIREGEWVRYSVHVSEAGWFNVGGNISSANSGNIVELSVGSRSLAKIELPSTNDVHTWMIVENLAKIYLSKGEQVLTLNMIKGQNWNLDYLKFTLSQNDNESE